MVTIMFKITLKKNDSGYNTKTFLNRMEDCSTHKQLDKLFDNLKLFKENGFPFRDIEIGYLEELVRHELV